MALAAGNDKVLFVRHFAFGDVLLTTPFYRMLAEADPNLRVDLYSRIDAVHTVLPGFGRFHFMDHCSLDQVLRQRYSSQYYFYYEFDRSLHILDGYSLSSGLPLVDRRLMWTVTAEEAARAAKLLEGLPRPLVGFLPLCGNPLKSLSEQKSQKIIDSVREALGATVALFADRHLDLVGCLNLTNKFASIRDLAAVMAQCDVFITIDTGPFHIAQALGIPTVGLFGCTLPELLATRPSTLQSVQVGELPCLGCYQRILKGQEVPLGCSRGDQICLEGLSEEEIVRAVVAALGGACDQRLLERIARYESCREGRMRTHLEKRDEITASYKAHIETINRSNKELLFRRRWKRKAKTFWKRLSSPS